MPVEIQIIAAIGAVVLPLVGVVLGAILSGRSQDAAWRRQKGDRASVSDAKRSRCC